MFANVTGRSALTNMREVLGALDVASAYNYITHDLRRGHVEDMWDNGGTLVEILHAGGWRCAVCVGIIVMQARVAAGPVASQRTSI